MERIAPAWFACWRCECTTIERTPAEIPDLCPTHGAALIWDNTGRPRLPLDSTPISGFGVLAKNEVRKDLRHA